MIQPPYLASSRLTIRRFRPADADDLHEYLSDPRVYRFEPGDPLDHAQAGQRAAEMATSADFWAVELRGAGKVIGQLYLKQIEPAELLTCELGYILHPSYQRQGYGSEAAAALVRHVLTAGGMHRVVAHCNPEKHGLVEAAGEDRLPTRGVAQAKYLLPAQRQRRAALDRHLCVCTAGNGDRLALTGGFHGQDHHSTAHRRQSGRPQPL